MLYSNLASYVYVNDIVGIGSAADDLSGKRRTALMTSSTVSG